MIFHLSVSEQKLPLGLDKSLKTIVGTFLQEIVMDDTLTTWGCELQLRKTSIADYTRFLLSDPNLE